MNTTTLTLATADGTATAFRSIGHIKSIAHIPTLTDAMNAACEENYIFDSQE